MKRKSNFILSAAVIAILFSGCNKSVDVSAQNVVVTGADEVSYDEIITPTAEITQLEEGFSTVRFQGDDGFQAFLDKGGASSDREVIEYLSSLLGVGLSFSGGTFGCSTISAVSPEGEHLFGRNFDWQGCEGLVVVSEPDEGYSSISTVNTNFIKNAAGGFLSDNNILTAASLYAPLDGMNEAGLAVSVNMIQDSDVINQNTGKPDLTTTTAVRLILNKAGSVDEAVSLLEQYDMHSSMNMMVHFALADKTGKSIVVEYVNNEMIVLETPVVTNFYIAEGDKKGIGSSQSHERYDILMKLLSENETMTAEQVRDALNSVSKNNFNEYESTEWSIVYNLDTGRADYYHRENYEKCYSFEIGGEEEGDELY
ncbi:MAG: C45 family autoproteolytic acyltransferase/hydrolase [Clostridiales bacterium]|nr:C45 family autoproteolytic acyltransferase/hydrolase [Clostridiales bacterium]